MPFFTPRGTGFSSLERTKALSRMGHSVEILTYSLGESVDISNVSIHRIPKLPFVRSIPMGPSFKKLLLDICLACKTAWWLITHRSFDLILAHEESAYWVALMRPFCKRTFIYDMHSSLVEQLSNFKYSKVGIIRNIFKYLEQYTLHKADGVIVICSELESLVRRIAPNIPVSLIENLPVSWDMGVPSIEQVDKLRSRLELNGCQVVMYTGSFGKNQGLELAIEAMIHVCSNMPGMRLLLIGGTGEDYMRVRGYAKAVGMEGSTVFLEPQPYTEMPTYMALADVLLSPRCEGTNTPLKIYSYLLSGKPIVATNLLTHTQVLNPSVAELVEANPAALASGIIRVLTDKEYSSRLGREAVKLAQEAYGIERYMKQLQRILNPAVQSSSRVC